MSNNETGVLSKDFTSWDQMNIVPTLSVQEQALREPPKTAAENTAVSHG